MQSALYNAWHSVNAAHCFQRPEKPLPLIFTLRGKETQVEQHTTEESQDKAEVSAIPVSNPPCP